MFSIKKCFLMGALLALVVCGLKPTPSQAATPAANTILVGLDKDYPPYAFFDEKGQATGFEVELLQAIGERYDLTFQFVPQSRDEIMDNLDKKRFQMAVSNFSYNDELRKKYALSNIHSYRGNVIVSLQSNKNKPVPETLDDLKKRKIIVLANSSHIENLCS